MEEMRTQFSSCGFGPALRLAAVGIWRVNQLVRDLPVSASVCVLVPVSMLFKYIKMNINNYSGFRSESLLLTLNVAFFSGDNFIFWLGQLAGKQMLVKAVGTRWHRAFEMCREGSMRQTLCLI